MEETAECVRTRRRRTASGSAYDFGIIKAVPELLKMSGAIGNLIGLKLQASSQPPLTMRRSA